MRAKTFTLRFSMRSQLELGLWSLGALCFVMLIIHGTQHKMQSRWQHVNVRNRSFAKVENTTNSILLDTIANRQTFSNKYPSSVDVVYTYVNGSDKNWQMEKKRYRVEFLADIEKISVDDMQKRLDAEKENTVDKANGENRFRDHEELKFSIRSLLQHASWVGKIFIAVATKDQVPYWLNVSHPKIHIVTHDMFFKDNSHLPTFNSAAIEANLHLIPGLSDYYLYLNDDIFFGKDASLDDFMLDKADGTQNVYFDFYVAISACSRGCKADILGNGVCDKECNNLLCNWDMGDCGPASTWNGLQDVSKWESKLRISPHGGSFMRSIVNVDVVFNREFGKNPYGGERRPIAHIPHLMNKHLVQDMAYRFPNFFESTSRHRLRHQRDLQYAFMYYYYLVHTRSFAPTIEQIWNAAMKTADTPQFLFGDDVTALYEDKMRDYHRLVIRSSTSFKILQECASNHISITPRDCLQALYALRDDHRLRLPSRVMKQMPLTDVTFWCLGSKPDLNIRALKRIMNNPRKFICIEDDMLEPYPTVDAQLQTTLSTLFSNVSESAENIW